MANRIAASWKSFGLSVSLRSGSGSEAVAPGYPVMPIANGLGSGFIRINGGQLGKRDGHLTPLPMDQHEQVGRAGVFRRHTPYFDSVSLAERRDDFGSDGLGLEGESDFVIEIDSKLSIAASSTSPALVTGIYSPCSIPRRPTPRPTNASVQPRPAENSACSVLMA